MNVLKIVAAAAVTLCATQANAVITFSTATPVAGYYSSFAAGGPIASVTGFTNTSIDSSSAVSPLLAAGGSYSYVSPVSTPTSATITFAAGVSSFTFLWGSPDAANELLVTSSTGTTTYTGAVLPGYLASADGSQSVEALFTVADTTGTLTSLTFSSPGKIAFEVAAIPEPETYALMLAGLGAIGFIARRRKSA